MDMFSDEALKLVWEGAIPLQIHLHESEVSTLTSPPPYMVLGPRMGYLPLLIPLIQPHFSSTLPPGADTVWFDYKGLPLKWYIPTGVLFDLLCAEPERPWNLTVHFRGYPGEVLTSFDGEDTIKWSYINSLKEASYIITGNCKNIMNMSQAAQFELWQSLVKGNMDGYQQISSKLRLGPLGNDCLLRTQSTVAQSRQRTGRIPIRLYVRSIGADVDDLEDLASVDSWDNISYINRPVEIDPQDGSYISLMGAMKSLLPEFLGNAPSSNSTSATEKDSIDGDSNFETSDTVDAENIVMEEASSTIPTTEVVSSLCRVKLIRIQGIELDLNIPFYWVVNNLMHPDFYLHVIVFIGPVSD